MRMGDSNQIPHFLIHFNSPRKKTQLKPSLRVTACPKNRESNLYPIFAYDFKIALSARQAGFTTFTMTNPRVFLMRLTLNEIDLE